MNDKGSEFELTAAQKSRLLSLGLGAEQPHAESGVEQKKAGLLHDMLAGTLPVDTAVVDSLPVVLKSICQDLQSVAGEPIGMLLAEPKTDISVIRRIKDHAKQLGTSTDSQIEHDVTVVIYMAAIAHALLCHDEKITQYKFEELKQSFSSLREQEWISAELAQLFENVCKHCDDKCREMEG